MKRCACHILTLLAILSASVLRAQTPAAQSLSSTPSNLIVVTPKGPEDGGDFGPKTPGTTTSGLQEAFDAAKARNKGLYISGGSLTSVESQPVVYFLHETLRIPWMQDFRLDGGHYVIQYTPKKGDAVVINSQMSCAYRFGLIVSNGDGAVVRLQPQSIGPDRFRVITSTEFIFNALVGGGGAWPGGEAFESDLDPKHAWKGVGLHVDGELGSIDANKITVLETVGCHVGLLVTGKVTRNSIEEANIHLCRKHVILGVPESTSVSDNRIQAFMDSQGIDQAEGVRLFGRKNLLTLSSSRMAPNSDIILEAPACDNVIIAHRLSSGITNHSRRPTNRLYTHAGTNDFVRTPNVPVAGQTSLNRNLCPVFVRFTDAGAVSRWFEIDVDGNVSEPNDQLNAGDTIILNPGEGFRWEGTAPPRWRWKAVR
jgi:hypothetical protein